MKKKPITKIKLKNSSEYSKLIKNRLLKSPHLDKKKIGGLMMNGYFKKSQRNTPLISIVMPNYKSKILSKSLNSLFNQSYKNLEIIVIDGNSGKNTIKILNKYTNKIDLWISENDEGMWHAWNKGLKLARGDFVGVVDSSNILYKNAIKILVKYITKYPNVDFICGAIKKDGKLYAGYKPEKIYKHFNVIPSSVVSLFIKNRSLKKTGYLNLKYKIQTDQDLIYRMIVKHKFVGINTKSSEVFGDLGFSGFSKRHSFFKILMNEINIRVNNNQNYLIILFIVIGRSFVKLINYFKKL